MPRKERKPTKGQPPAGLGSQSQQPEVDSFARREDNKTSSKIGGESINSNNLRLKLLIRSNSLGCSCVFNLRLRFASQFLGSFFSASDLVFGASKKGLLFIERD